MTPPETRRRITTATGCRWLSVGVVVRLFGRSDPLSPQTPQIITPDAPTRERLQFLMGEALRGWKPNPAVAGTAAVAGLLPPMRSQGEEAQWLADGVSRSLFLLVRKLMPQTPAQHAMDHLPDWLTATIQRIDGDLKAADPPLLAQAAGYSPAQFRRLFREWLHTSPQEYVTERRIAEARRLLEITDDTVASIGDRIGFESLSYFTRLFTQHTGVSPARWRDSVRFPRV